MNKSTEGQARCEVLHYPISKEHLLQELEKCQEVADRIIQREHKAILKDNEKE